MNMVEALRVYFIYLFSSEKSFVEKTFPPCAGRSSPSAHLSRTLEEAGRFKHTLRRVWQVLELQQ